MKNNYRGVIFDLDGTLVDTVDDLTDALNAVLDQYGLPRTTSSQAKNMIGNGLRMLITRAVPVGYKNDQAFLDKALEELKEAYKKIWVNKSKVYPGIAELLQYCQDNGIKIAVSSNKVDDAVQYIIKTLFPEITFDVVIGNQAGVPHKPNPMQTDKIVEEMGLSPKEILYIGDSEVDYHTALNSNLTPIILSYGYGDYNQIQRIPGVIVREKPEDILAFLDT